jgi:hypothetical protein
MLELYRSLLHLRADRPSLHRGALELRPADPALPDVLAYERVAPAADPAVADGSMAHRERTLVVVNFGSSAAAVDVGPGAEILATTDVGTLVAGGTLTLPAHSGSVLDLT